MQLKDGIITGELKICLAHKKNYFFTIMRLTIMLFLSAKRTLLKY